MEKSILDPDPNPNQSQNVIDWSLIEDQKDIPQNDKLMWFKYVNNFLRYYAHCHTQKQTLSLQLLLVLLFLMINVFKQSK